MIIYQSTYRDFVDKFNGHMLFNDIMKEYREKIGFPNSGMQLSWHNSITEVIKSLKNSKIDSEVQVLIEYKIPRDGSQIDLVFIGKSLKNEDSIAVVELKQWENAKKTNVYGMVNTNVGGSDKHYHPSFQVLNYIETLKNIDSNSFSNIRVLPVVFMHNYSGSDLYDQIYENFTKKAPIFNANQYSEFADFIESNVGRNSSADFVKVFKELSFNPSVSLISKANQFSNELQDKMRQYTLYGSQKNAYDVIINTIRGSSSKSLKNVFILKGQAGSGKTIMALTMYLDFMYINSNIPTRMVFPGHDLRETLKEVFNLKKNSDIFRCISGAPVQSSSYRKGEFDIAIVDEAHKLARKASITGLRQLETIIKTHETTILLMDDDQSISKKAIGTIANSIEIIEENFGKNVEVTTLSLEGQFRSNGGFEYINWLNGWLKQRHNPTIFENGAFTVAIEDSAESFINTYTNDCEKNKRLLTTVSFDWTRKFVNGKPHKDISIGNHKFCWNPYDPSSFDGYKNLSKKQKEHFRKNYNLDDDFAFSTFGYQNTVQGSEFKTTYIYMGKDIYLDDNNELQINELEYKGNELKSTNGMKGMELEEAKALNKRIIINSYNVLFTRAINKVVVFAYDDKLNNFLKSIVKENLDIH